MEKEKIYGPNGDSPFRHTKKIRADGLIIITPVWEGPLTEAEIIEGQRIYREANGIKR